MEIRMAEGVESSRFVKGTSIPPPANTDASGVLSMLMHPLSVLLVCLPLGVAAESEFMDWGPTAIFFLNFFALVPLAKILGDATEELAEGLKNDMLAGLLNATFGNAVEMVIMVNTLRAGLIDMVKATLLGSVLSNLLLVLGMSFFCGGIVGRSAKKTGATKLPTSDKEGSPEEEEEQTEWVQEKVQSFSKLNALTNTSMLLLACMSFSLVTVFYAQAADAAGVPEDEIEEILLPVSRLCAIIIVMAYAAYIFFQLVTHRGASAEDNGGGPEEEPEEARVSAPTAVVVMLICTVIVAYASDCMVNSLEGVVENAHISSHFIGIILLPIVGNACEHASAIRFAIMDKPGLSIGIAVGSSTQISLFVVPFAVLSGWALDKPMDLNFGSLNTTVMVISVVVVLSVVVDGQSNWLQGYLLMSCYTIAAILYWYLPDAHIHPHHLHHH